MAIVDWEVSVNVATSSLLAEGSEGLKLLIEASDASRVVIVVDQFEEVFTLCQDRQDLHTLNEKDRISDIVDPPQPPLKRGEFVSPKVEREHFFECLLGAVEKLQGKLCLILAMWADFFGKCLEQEYSGLGKKIQENLVSVTPMNREQLKDAIALPARQVNLGVEEALIEQMLREIEGSPGSLPLLEYTLTRLWEESTDNQLKLSTYVDLGGIGGTLNRRATEVYQQFSGTDQQIAKQIFLCLTQLGEGTEDTRRRVLKPDLITEKYPQSALEKVIQKLADEKLIVTNEQAGKGDVSQRVVVIDVAHEALIRRWDLLREWLDENRDALRKQRKIEEEAKYWLEKDKDKELLWFGSRLAETEEVLKEYASTLPVPLSPLAREFLQTSSQEELSAYLRNPDIDNLEREALEKEAARKSFLKKERLWPLLTDEKEEAQIRLAASWLLKQWGEVVPIWTAEVDNQGKIALSIIAENDLPTTVIEELEGGISLEMVELPGGEFWMGSPEEEEGSNSWEKPQHKVKVSPFLIGKYPVTQAQWRAVASLPQVERNLNPEPSYYKGDSLPVVSISWYEAVEFCKRLSRLSQEKGKAYQYRLPSEAEWEKACRAVISRGNPPVVAPIQNPSPPTPPLEGGKSKIHPPLPPLWKGGSPKSKTRPIRPIILGRK